MSETNVPNKETFNEKIAGGANDQIAKDARFKIKKIFKLDTSGYIVVSEDNKCYNILNQIEFNYIDKNSDKSHTIHLGYDEKTSLIEADGKIFKYDNKEILGDIKRYDDGSTVFSLPGSKLKIRIDVSQEPVNYKNEIEFINIQNIGHKFVAYTLQNGKYILKNDNQLFEYDGKKEFVDVTCNSDGSITIVLAENKYILLEANGRLFEYNGNTEFNFLLKLGNGVTQVQVNKDSEVLNITTNGKIIPYNEVHKFNTTIYDSTYSINDLDE